MLASASVICALPDLRDHHREQHGCHQDRRVILVAEIRDHRQRRTGTQCRSSTAGARLSPRSGGRTRGCRAARSRRRRPARSRAPMQSATRRPAPAPRRCRVAARGRCCCASSGAAKPATAAAGAPAPTFEGRSGWLTCFASARARRVPWSRRRCARNRPLRAPSRRASRLRSTAPATTGATTSCATRSPRRTVKGSWPAFISTPGSRPR